MSLHTMVFVMQACGRGIQRMDICIRNSHRAASATELQDTPCMCSARPCHLPYLADWVHL